MRRRQFITLVVGATAWPLAARAQQTERVRRIGILFGGFSDADPEPRARIEAFTRQLQEFGWIDGRNMKIELRVGGGDDNRRRADAEELVGWMPDVIVANSAPAVVALARQTKAIPIVFTSFVDPVGSGLVASLARPGGNLTGFTNFEPSMCGKWLDLLKTVSPGITRVIYPYNPATLPAFFPQSVEAAAPALSLKAVPAQNADDVSSLHRSACAVDRRHRDAELRLEDAGTIAPSSTLAAIIGRDTPGGFPAWRRAPWAVLQ
jgi:putative tryptophan/tyrosine transport system substrate-binding protein